MADQLLEVVNEADVVTGTALRSHIHAQGLRHREVHVLFVTPNAQVIFQRRSPSKESYPNHLDATAGGHVEPGQSYLEAALMEVREETGQQLNPEDLQEIAKLNVHQPHTADAGGNLVYRMVYALPWTNGAETLVVEENDGAGFTAIPLATLAKFSEENPGEFVPHLMGLAYQSIWQQLAQQKGKI